MVQSITERVSQGVEWLDGEIPQWWDKVSLPALDLTSTCNCVLGQVFMPQAEKRINSPHGVTNPANFGGYDWAVLEENVMSTEEATYYGFDVSDTPEDYGFESETDEYRLLQDEWTRVINERKAANV